MERAIILVDGYFDSIDGKTAHGLIRYSKRWRIVGVIDSKYAGKDAGEILDGIPRGIPIFSSLDEALRNVDFEWLIIGVATEGGKLPREFLPTIKEALKRGISIVSGLHEFLSEMKEFREIARYSGAKIIDVRKIFMNRKIPFRGVIEEVKAFKVAVLGTDAAIGKRTTAILLHEGLKELGYKSVFIGTGQTAWMQGVSDYVVVLDALINDFVAGNIEDVIYRAWIKEKPELMIIEGQGSIFHPAFPGSFEIIAAARPDAIILQHALKRKTFDGFPKYPIPPLDDYIFVLQKLSGSPIIGISINHEMMTKDEVRDYCRWCTKRFGLICRDPLWDGVDDFIERIISLKEEIS